MKKDKSLDVFYKGKTVGTLAETDDKRIAFQYSDSWIKEGFSISPFSLPLKSEVFVPGSESREYFKGLFGVFADSLPDSWGELLLNRVLESTGLFRSNITTLERLSYVGSSGMGALEYYPSRTADFNVNGMDYDEIANECKKILSSKPSDKIDVLYNLGGSSGGTRPKILISENDKEYIIKFPSSRDYINSGKREYDYSLCAKKCGIEMMDTSLVPSKYCDGYFKTERFDRKENEKILSVTVAGLLELDFRAPSCDYGTYMKLTNVLTREDLWQVEQMFRVMCFNVYTHNLDDHTKNFSFLKVNDKWKLAPAYDLTYSDTFFGEHTTSVNGKGVGISDDDLIKVGNDAGLNKLKCKSIIGEIKENIHDLDQYIYSHANIKEKTGKIPLKHRVEDLLER